MVLTNAQIKTILDGITFPETVVIYDYLQEKNRRKFTNSFIEIENKNPEQETADRRVTETRQEFMIHLFKKSIVANSEEEASLSILEGLIKTALDTAQIGGVELFEEEKSWERNIRERPIKYNESILTIIVNDVASTESGGSVGAEMTITIGALSDMPLLSVPTGPDRERFESIIRADGKRTKIVPFADERSVFAEVVDTEARRTSLRSQKATRLPVSVTLKRTGQSNEVFSAVIVDISAGGTVADVQSLFVQLEVEST